MSVVSCRPSTLGGQAPFPMPHPGPIDESKWSVMKRIDQENRLSKRGKLMQGRIENTLNHRESPHSE